MAFTVFLQGLALSFGLIVAIGAQNAFVLRQGLRREHVGVIVLFCALADLTLIAAGVLGLAQVLEGRAALARWLALGGAVFLTVYGLRALQRAGRGSSMAVADGSTGLSRSAALLQATAFTLLNPHVYVDTVVLVGGIGAQHPPALRGWFVLGAASASACWFGLLGYGARWLAPWFARPRSWQILDALIGLTLCALAVLLLREVLQGS